MDDNQIQPTINEDPTRFQRQEDPVIQAAGAPKNEARLNDDRKEPIVTPGKGKSAGDGLHDTKDIIYKTYREYADAEDKEMIGRWTETLNIMLTFAGLQSAVVTAFILALYQDLKPSSSDLTNRLLEKMLHRLDNSTAIPTDACISRCTSAPMDDCVNACVWAVPRLTVVVLAWWHVSLACSLLSAFGTLMSKQWVMHYHSQDPSVNTSTRRAQLREARYQGLRSWGFFTVFEFLSILLQLSLLFFAIGLVVHLQPKSGGLMIVTTVPIGVAGVFYIFTSIAGAIHPTCPFKSPLTTFAFKLGSTVVWWSRIIWVTIRGPFVIAFSWIVQSHVDSHAVVKGIKEAWSHSMRMHVGYWFIKALHGDESIGVGENSIGAAGVLFWWLCQEDRRTEDGHQINTTAVIDKFVSLDPIMLHRLQSTEIFDYWTSTVIWKLFSVVNHLHPGLPAITQTHNFDAAQLTDALCHFVHHSPRAARIAMNAVPDNIDNKFWYFCHAIRQIWANPAHPLHPAAAGLLPIQEMRWSTVAVYIRTQLRDWCAKTQAQDNRRYRTEILQELPLVLLDSRLGNRLEDVANIVSLAAIALVDDLPGVARGVLAGLVGSVNGILPTFKAAIIAGADGVVPDSQSRQILVNSDPLDQLLLALHRLSHYRLPNRSIFSTDQPGISFDSYATELLPQLIKASRVSLSCELSELVASKLDVPDVAAATDTSKFDRWRVRRWGSNRSKLVRSKLVGCCAWKDGRLGDALLWLFDLGTIYREGEPNREGMPNDAAGALIRERQGLVMVLCEHYSPTLPTDQDLHGLLALSTPTGLSTIMNVYADKLITSPSHVDSLGVLDCVLGLRYYSPQPSSRSILPQGHSKVYKYPRNAHTSLLTDNSHILGQLICDVQAYGPSKETDKATISARLLLLSVVVKGRDLFFPLNLALNYEGLASELSSISDKMFSSGSFFGWKTDVVSVLLGFAHWDELLRALEDSQLLLVNKTDQDEPQSPLKTPSF